MSPNTGKGGRGCLLLDMARHILHSHQCFQGASSFMSGVTNPTRNRVRVHGLEQKTLSGL